MNAPTRNRPTARTTTAMVSRVAVAAAANGLAQSTAGIRPARDRDGDRRQTTHVDHRFGRARTYDMP